MSQYAGPLKRAAKGQPLSALDHDSNLDAFDFRTGITPEDCGAGASYAEGIDDTAAVLAAMASERPVVLRRFYRVSNIKIPRLRGRKVVQGGGATTGLVGIDNTKPVLQTYDPSDLVDDYQYGPALRNFTIAGVGSCALAVGQTIGALIEDIHLCNDLNGTGDAWRRFVGADGFVFEETFGNTFRNLFTNGATISRSPFRINSTVLASIWDMLYTSNATDYLVDIDGARRELDTVTTNSGHGVLQFNTPTMQGAQKYSWRIANTRDMMINNQYSESNMGEALIVHGTANVSFHSCSFLNNNANRTHSIWIEDQGTGQTTNVSFENCVFPNKAIVLGEQLGPVRFTHCDVLGGGDFFPLIKKVPDLYSYDGASGTNSNLGVTVIQQKSNSSNNSEFIMKCGNWSFARLTMDASGNPQGSTPEVLPDITHGPY